MLLCLFELYRGAHSDFFSRHCVCVAAAGIAGKAGGVFKETRANFAHVLDTNVAGVLIITQSFLPLLRKSTLKVPARVLNVSSGLGSIALQANLIKYFGADNSSIAYNISKAALNCLTADFAASEPSIIFTAASPGWVDTDVCTHAHTCDGPLPQKCHGLCALPVRLFLISVSSLCCLLLCCCQMGSNGGKASPPVKVADCAQALRALVESLSSDQSGSFVDNIEGGKVIPY